MNSGMDFWILGRWIGDECAFTNRNRPPPQKGSEPEKSRISPPSPHKKKQPLDARVPTFLPPFDHCQASAVFGHSILPTFVESWERQTESSRSSHFSKTYILIESGWWLNQPIFKKKCESKWVHLPQIEVEIRKYLKPPPRSR